MINVEWVLGELRRTLAHLAEPAHEQLEYLRGLGNVSNDELALEFDAVAPVTPALEAEGYLSSEQAEAIVAVGERLEAMSGATHGALWGDAGILSAPEWDQVRGLAASALALLRDEGQLPP